MTNETFLGKTIGILKSFRAMKDNVSAYEKEVIRDVLLIEEELATQGVPRTGGPYDLILLWWDGDVFMYSDKGNALAYYRGKHLYKDLSMRVSKFVEDIDRNLKVTLDRIADDE